LPFSALDGWGSGGSRPIQARLLIVSRASAKDVQKSLAGLRVIHRWRVRPTSPSGGAIPVNPGAEAGRAEHEGHQYPHCCHIALHFGTMVPTHEAGTVMKSLVVKRSIFLAGRKTSVSLEDEFWTALREIAGDRHVTLSELFSGIDKQRQHADLSSALRLFVLEHYRGKAAEKPDAEMLGQRSPPSVPVLS
jgi:predicted DNA-binding ribbon-helix-helix protein